VYQSSMLEGSENGVVAGNGAGKSRPKKKRAPIANLPKGISVGQVTIKGKDLLAGRFGEAVYRRQAGT